MTVAKSGSSQSGNQNGTSTTTPNAPDGWEDAWRNLAGGINGGGFTPDQQGAVNYFKGRLAANNDPVTNPALATINSDYLLPYTKQATPTLGAAPTVTAQTGSSLSQPYLNTATDQVVNATNADLKAAYDRNLAASGLQSAGAGAFGGSRQGVREAQMADDYLRNVSTTTAQTRYGAFDAAQRYGLQDAGNFLAASSQNVQIQNQRDIANQAAEFQNRANQMSALNAITNNVNTYQGNINNAQTRQDNYAANIFNSGSGGFSQGMQILAGGAPLFGSTTNQQQQSSQSGKSGGASVGGASVCWVAREVYGLDGPWQEFRAWLLNDAPKWLLVIYTRHGEAFAEWIKDKPRVKYVIRAFMDKVTK